MAVSFQPPSHLFERNISLNDLDLALNVREIVRKDVVVPEEATKHRHMAASTSYSFVLPSLQNIEEEFRKFVFSFLVDGHILRELETARRLNWCGSLCRMVTVNTLGDGNCLMHAASIGMWAVNDRYQTLRKTVYQALVEDVEGTRFYHSRWKSEEYHHMLTQNGGYERTEEQWAHEWEELIKHVSQTEFPFGTSGAQFGSLEEIHIFVLANVLRRTIIVVSDETLRGHFDESYAPINFGGIYLPLLWDSIDCVKSPLVIGYADGHFTAVVSIEDGKLDLGLERGSVPTIPNCIHAVPLVKFDGTSLPVHFLFDHEVPLASDRLRQYLDCAKVTLANNSGESRSTIIVAKLHFTEQPQCMKDLVEGYFAKAREEYQRVSRCRQNSPQFQPGLQQPALQIVPCQTQGCGFYGSTETGNRCSKCLNEYLRALGPAASQPSPHVPARQAPAVRHQERLNASAAATPINLPRSSYGNCRTTGCKYAAVPEQGGLCERCFDAERSAEELAASMRCVHLATATPCANRANGCEFFGLPEHHNLCSRCYRAFCLQMESSLGVGSPTGLPPSSPTAAGAVRCQTPNCQSQGVPALYGMCVTCYTGCIHSFISSEGRSVGNMAPASALPKPLLAHPPGIGKRTQLPAGTERKPAIPTGAGKKGVLCASPGCVNEGVFHYGDLCAECYGGRSSLPLPSMNNPGSALSSAAAIHFPVIQPPPNTGTAMASVAPTHQMGSGSTTPGQTNPLCRRCEGRISGPSWGNPEWKLPHPEVPVQKQPVASSTTARTSPTQRAPVVTGSHTAPLCSSGQRSEASHQPATPLAVSAAPTTQVRPNLCAFGCDKPAVLDNGLCQQCYARAVELELNRGTVSQPSRQQQATASGISGNQVPTSVPTNSSKSLRTTEPEAATKKAGVTNPLPCNSRGCPSFGSPEKSGLCEECFRKKGNKPLTASSSQTSNSQGFQRGYGTPPVEQNRQFGNTAAPASDVLHRPVQVSPSYRSEDLGLLGRTEEYVGGRKCRQPNCPLFGTPETNGLCSRCFLDSTMPQSGPCSIPDFPSEASSYNDSVASCASFP